MFVLKIQTAMHDAGGFLQLHLERPQDYSYKPGQYAQIQFTAADKPKMLAFASHPSEETLFFMSRDEIPTAETLSVFHPQGSGFLCDFADPRPILFLTHGTGISAIRSAMLERRARGFSTDTLLYGIAAEHAEPDIDCLKTNFPVRQLRAHSQAEYRAYVQDRLQALDAIHFGAVLLIGSREMMAACHEILATKQFPPEKIFSNF
ncbi:MAG: hypothetical protein JSR44_11210 [Spirochaetes bacterium]|nr:hypothetical protein [Spirochaetota bacterium]